MHHTRVYPKVSRLSP